jgi:hypothetical protein
MIAYLSGNKKKYSLWNGVNATIAEIIEKLNRLPQLSSRTGISQA